VRARAGGQRPAIFPPIASFPGICGCPTRKLGGPGPSRADTGRCRLCRCRCRASRCRPHRVRSAARSGSRRCRSPLAGRSRAPRRTFRYNRRPRSRIARRGSRASSRRRGPGFRRRTPQGGRRRRSRRRTRRRRCHTPCPVDERCRADPRPRRRSLRCLGLLGCRRRSPGCLPAERVVVSPRPGIPAARAAGRHRVRFLSCHR
jgi:hypothetical protein